MKAVHLMAARKQREDERWLLRQDFPCRGMGTHLLPLVRPHLLKTPPLPIVPWLRIKALIDKSSKNTSDLSHNTPLPVLHRQM